jgi:hypothetical protein
VEPVSRSARRARAARAEARRRPRPDEGFAMSSPIALMAAAAVTLAGAAFVATDGTREAQRREAALVNAPAQVEPRTTIVAKKVKRVVKRSDVYVEVYNNTNITGLAGETGARISAAGWQLVTTDNWVGTIPATTVYYPAQLKAAAQLLGKDLGIQRIIAAEDPMSMDRLTVVLTSDFG